jgi:hypothetical protein
MDRRTACRRNAPADMAAPDWFPIATNAAPFQFLDLSTSDSPQRFYRALSQP